VLIEAMAREIVDYRRADVSLKQELRNYIDHLKGMDVACGDRALVNEIASGLEQLVEAQPRLRATRWPLRREDSVNFHLPDHYGKGRRVSLVWHNDGQAVRLVADGNYPIKAEQVSSNTIHIEAVRP